MTSSSIPAQEFPFFFTVGTASLGLGQLSGPTVGGLLADWFGPSAIGWFAAAIYGGRSRGSE